jgi:hypothetical protein
MNRNIILWSDLLSFFSIEILAPGLFTSLNLFPCMGMECGCSTSMGQTHSSYRSSQLYSPKQVPNCSYEIGVKAFGSESTWSHGRSTELTEIAKGILKPGRARPQFSAPTAESAFWSVRNGQIVTVRGFVLVGLAWAYTLRAIATRSDHMERFFGASFWGPKAWLERSSSLTDSRQHGKLAGDREKLIQATFHYLKNCPGHFLSSHHGNKISSTSSVIIREIARQRSMKTDATGSRSLGDGGGTMRDEMKPPCGKIRKQRRALPG